MPGPKWPKTDLEARVREMEVGSPDRLCKGVWAGNDRNSTVAAHRQVELRLVEGQSRSSCGSTRAGGS